MADRLEANAKANREPDTWYGLAGRLAALEQSTMNQASWKSEIKRIRNERPPTEERAQMIADVLLVDMDELPPVHQRPVTTAQVAAELAVAMRHIAKLEKRVESLEARRSRRAAPPKEKTS